MNASPQPSVVPRTGIASTGTNRSPPPSGRPSNTPTPRDPNVTTTSLPWSCATPRIPATVGSSSPPGQPTKPMSTSAIVSRHPLDRVVAEGRGSRRRPRGPSRAPAVAEPAQLADRALDEHEVQPARRRDAARSSSGVQPERRPDALDEVVHPGLEVGLDDDVDRRRPARRDQRRASDGIPWRSRNGAEHLGPVVADPRQQAERHVRSGASARPCSARRRRAARGPGRGRCRGSARPSSSCGRRPASPPAVTGPRAAAARPSPERQEPVVADLDDLAHLPERLDREVPAALDVVPLAAARGAS